MLRAVQYGIESCCREVYDYLYRCCANAVLHTIPDYQKRGKSGCLFVWLILVILFSLTFSAHEVCYVIVGHEHFLDVVLQIGVVNVDYLSVSSQD